MPRYEIRATMDVDAGQIVDLDRLRSLVDGDVRLLSRDVVSVVVTAESDDPWRVAFDVVGPLREVSRCGIWTARRRGVLGLGRRVNGGWSGSGLDDDGLGGVREPRRPRPSGDSASVALDPPTD